MRVHRLSASLLKDHRNVQRAAELLAEEATRHRLAVVLSPLHGMDTFIENLISSATRDDPRAGPAEFLERHRALARILDVGTQTVLTRLDEIVGKLTDLITGIHLTRHCTTRTRELLHALGIQATGVILQAVLERLGTTASLIDHTQNLIWARPGKPYPIVEWEASRQAISRWATSQQGLVLIGALLATTPTGRRIDLGRNSGDYVASLIAAALEAPSLTVWLDEDGLPVAPTRFIPNPKRIRQMSYEESMELSYFGSDLLHPYTLLPLVNQNIPLTIRSIHSPSTVSTVIHGQGGGPRNGITGLTCIQNLTLLNIEGGGMVGIPGFAARVFAALSSAQVNVIMISQASSEHSICLAISEEETGRAVQALEKELAQERQNGQIGSLDIQQPCSIVAIIGDGMRGMTGLSGRVFGAVGRGGANVLAIAQGSSERNISFAVLTKDCEAAVRSLYEEFFGGAE